MSSKGLKTSLYAGLSVLILVLSFIGVSYRIAEYLPPSFGDLAVWSSGVKSLHNGVGRWVEEPNVFIPGHKDFFPVKKQDIFLISVAAVATFLAAGAGIGGGGLLLPVYLFIGGFNSRESVALANVTILGGSIGNLVSNIRRRHPRRRGPLIDWDLVLLMEPTTIAGALLGGYLNTILPTWFTCVTLSLVLTLIVANTSNKAKNLYRRETRLLIERGLSIGIQDVMAITRSPTPAKPTKKSIFSLSRNRSSDRQSSPVKAEIAPGAAKAGTVSVEAHESHLHSLSSGGTSTAVHHPSAQQYSAKLGIPISPVPYNSAYRVSVDPGSENVLEKKSAAAPHSSKEDHDTVSHGGVKASGSSIGNIISVAQKQGSRGSLNSKEGQPSLSLENKNSTTSSSHGTISSTADVTAVLTVVAASTTSVESPFISTGSSTFHNLHNGVVSNYNSRSELRPATPRKSESSQKDFSAEAPGAIECIRPDALDDIDHSATAPSSDISTSDSLSSSGSVIIRDEVDGDNHNGKEYFINKKHLLISQKLSNNKNHSNSKYNLSHTAYSSDLHEPLLLRLSNTADAPFAIGDHDEFDRPPILRAPANDDDPSSVLSYSAGRNPEYFSDEESGFVDPKDPLVLARKMFFDRESTQHPWVKIVTISLLSFWLIFSESLKERVPCGSLLYWTAVLSVLPPIAAIMAGFRTYLLDKMALRAHLGIALSDGDIPWNKKSTIIYPLICSLAGVVAGMFGVGGGIVKGPLMLELGVLPEVSAATAATMILFTSSAASAVFLQFGLVDPVYGSVLFATGFVFSLAGQVTINKLIQRWRRRSPILFVLVGLLGVSAALVFSHAVEAILVIVKEDPSGWFKFGRVCPL